MAAVIARVTGTALTPGVSRNGRLYTKEAIGKAVARAQDRISENKRPISMRSHHASGDDSLRVVGRVTRMWQDPDTGAARYDAAIADTPAGQVIKALTDDSDGQPAFLRGVSIRGGWMQEPRQEQVDGRDVETADDLEISGLDYTAEPGVDDADVTHMPAAAAADGGREENAETHAHPITESAPEALVSATPQTLTELLAANDGWSLERLRAETAAALDETTPTSEAAQPLKSGKAAAPQTKATSYADPGYQPDKMKRFALDTKTQAKAAWSYIHQADNAKNYTAQQLKRIKGRIIKALKRFGVAVTAEHWLIDPAQQITESTTLAECMGDYGEPRGAGSFYVSLTNGPVSVTVSSYTVDPADLDLIGRAAMDGAVRCLTTIDPDLDGDMDVPGAEAEDTDHDMDDDEPAPNALVVGTACPCGCGCAIPADPAATNCPCACDDCPICGSTSAADADESVGPQPTPNADAPTPPITVESTQPPAPEPDADPITETEAPAMAESTTPAVEPTPAAPVPAAPVGTMTLTDEQFKALLAAAFGNRATEAAPAAVAPVTEAVPQAAAAAHAPAATPAQPAPAAPVAESQEQMMARLIAESQRTLIQSLAESGALPGRRGLTAQSPAALASGQAPATLAEGVNAYGMPAGAPDKPLHQYTTEELNRWAGPMVFEHAVGHYATRRA